MEYRLVVESDDGAVLVMTCVAGEGVAWMYTEKVVDGLTVSESAERMGTYKTLHDLQQTLFERGFVAVTE